MLFFGVPDIYEDEGRKGALEEMRVWVLMFLLVVLRNGERIGNLSSMVSGLKQKKPNFSHEF